MTDAHWGDIKVDDYIADRAGIVWRICAVDETEAASADWTGAFRARNQAGDWTTIASKLTTEHVTLVIPTDETGPYIELLRDRLGAEVVATQDYETKVWKCDRWPTEMTRSLGPLKTHLTLCHSMYIGDVKGFTALVEAHEAAHDPEQPRVGKHLPHIH